MKNKNRYIILGIVVVVLFITLAQATYSVGERQQVIITQFGKPIGDAITKAGLHFKTPFIQTANFFDKRYMEWDGDPNQVPTKDKKFIFVDSYARWRISDPLQFFKRLTNERGAQSRLDDILDGETRDFIANNNLEETVRSSNRIPMQAGEISELLSDSLSKIKVGRKEIQEMIRKAANDQAKDLGIEILDFRFKRINYVKEVRKQVYERMKSERYRIADKFKSEGQGEASRINGEKERELLTIQSEAFKEAEEIKGKADAKAAATYAAAYNKSSQSRDLYGFLKSMMVYKNTFDSNTSVILSTNSDLYKYLNKMK